MWSSISFHERGLAPHDSKNKPSVVVIIRPGSVNVRRRLLVSSNLFFSQEIGIFMLSLCQGLSSYAKAFPGFACNALMEWGRSRAEVKVNKLLGGPFRGSLLKNNIYNAHDFRPKLFA
jgi:hypothetical protein